MPPNHVTILLPVFNGAAYLPDQLNSLLAQSIPDWTLLISDDGSTDGSRDILQAFCDAHPDRVLLFDGPRRGVCANVLSLLAQVDPESQALAFCDQDDVWDPDRLARGMAALGASQRPRLYCSRTRLVDESGVFQRVSPALHRAPSFQNALVQNIASGNTMILNRAGLQLLMRLRDRAQPIAHHDWWAYQIISGAGGQIIHDERPTLNYRQHRRNVVGAATGLRGALKRIYRLCVRDLSRDIKAQWEVLQTCRDSLTPEHADLVARLTQTRAKSPLHRLSGLIRAGVYRQTQIGTFALWTAAVAGRV